MEFYLSLDGSKVGPYSIFKVGDLLESGEINGDTLAWHRELETWKPIKDIPSLDAVRVITPDHEPPPPSLPPHVEEIGSSPLPSVEPEQEVPALRRSRPFVRFWARMFDYLLVSTLVFQVSDVPIPVAAPGEGFADLFARYLEEMQKPEALVMARTLFFALIGWHFIEATLLHLIGTTPGKFLFGVSLTTATGERIPFLRSLGRSFYVYILGVGFYQFPFILIGMIFSFSRMNATGKCLWDQHLDLNVRQAPLSIVRLVLAIGAFFCVFLLQTFRI